MSAKIKNSSKPYLILIGIILLIVVVFYFLFRTEDLKNRKDDLEADFQKIKEQINEKEQNVKFLTAELNRLKLIKDCIVDYAVRLYTTIKLILLTILIGISFIVYVLFNFDMMNSLGVILPIFTFGYYGVTIAVKNRIGDFNRTLKLLQEYFINIVFKLKRFDVTLIEVIEAKIVKEMEQINQLRHKCTIYELKGGKVNSNAN